jgi:hypothetical protein
VRAPIRPLRGALPRTIEGLIPARFCWRDPGVILAPDVSADDFRVAMNAFNVGATIKITGTQRHVSADALLLDNLDLSEAAIVDIGASDGSTSVDLIAKLPGFRSYTIADLYLYVQAVRLDRHTVFFDPDGTCILVVGHRLVAWPSISAPVRLLYRALINRATRQRESQPMQVLLLNPAAQALIAADARIQSRVHDVFTPWPAPAPDVIKVANLLRRLYFGDDEIRRALDTLLHSLDNGGHLLIVDNPRIKGGGTRAGLYRRDGDQFVAVAHTEQLPEIDDLVCGIAD